MRAALAIVAGGRPKWLGEVLQKSSREAKSLLPLEAAPEAYLAALIEGPKSQFI